MKFVWLLMLALIGATANAHACTDSAAMRYYFFDRPPDERAGREVLPVRILAIAGDVVRARLDGPFAKALGHETVTIDLPQYPLGGNCVSYGLTNGPVFVIVERVIRLESGEMRIIAASPVKGRYDTRPRRSRAELESYIVDPAVKEALAKERRAP